MLSDQGNLYPRDVQNFFLVVKLKHGGEKYALDLSGAQYGFYEPIAPFQSYVSRNFQITLDGANNFGNMKRMAMRAADGSQGSINKAVVCLNASASTALKDAVVSWEKHNETTFKDVLKLGEVGCRKKEARLFGTYY